MTIRIRLPAYPVILLIALLWTAGCATPTKQHHPAAFEDEQFPPSFPKSTGNPADRKKHEQDLKAWFSPPPENEPQPVYTCDQPNAPVPTVWKGQTARFSWVVSNTGNAPLRLSMST